MASMKNCVEIEISNSKLMNLDTHTHKTRAWCINTGDIL